MRPVALVLAGVLVVFVVPVDVGASGGMDPHDITDPHAWCNFAGEVHEQITGHGWACAPAPGGPSAGETVRNASDRAEERRAELDRTVEEEVLTRHDPLDPVEASAPDGETFAVAVCRGPLVGATVDVRGIDPSRGLSSTANATPAQAGPCGGVDLSWLQPYYEGTVGGIGTPEVEECAVTFAVSTTAYTEEIVVETTAFGGERARSGCFSHDADVRRPGGDAAPAATHRDRHGIAPPARRRLADRTADATAPAPVGHGPPAAADTESAPVDAVTGPAARRVALAATGLLGAGLVGVRLYRRLSRDQILDNDLRNRMMETVRDEPAIHASELARRLDVAVTTVLYHGRMLADADLVVMRRAQGEVVFLDRSAGDDALEREALCVLRSDAKRRVVEALLGAPGANMAEIARRVERARNTVKHHVDDLIEAGLVEDRSSTRTRELVVPDQARDALERHL